MTHLCVAIFVESVEQAKRDIATAIESGAEMIEFRVDAFQDDRGFIRDESIGHLVHLARLPCIVTCRPVSEGGMCELTEDQRFIVLDNAFAGGAAYVDVELAACRSLPKECAALGGSKIVSIHDFSERPRRLYNIVDELNTAPGAVNKLVWMARSVRDNIEAFELLRHRQKPTIALCMGEAGLLSRVLAKKFGAFLTYASLRPTEATAPGQPTIDEIKNLYRWDAIDRDTKVYGVVGSPIGHSLSPAVHNAAFEHESINAVYLPMVVNPGYESFKAFMESFLAFKPLDLSGLSITIPHKENALRYLKERGAAVDPLAERVGAVNTIKIDGSTLAGFNTDFDAILDTITTALSISRDELADKRVAVIGAGGTGRTAVAALSGVGATIVVYNRTREKADALAKEFDGRDGKVVSARMEKLCDSCCHIFINTTPIGMHPNVDASPLGDRLPKFEPDTLVFDTIYNPTKTRLLRQAEAAGARTIGGMEMFIRQAAKQFEIWTDRRAPADLMRRAADAHL
jgi:3-dehydroquinate dehydratase/shikimate dehydrogenase